MRRRRGKRLISLMLIYGARGLRAPRVARLTQFLEAFFVKGRSTMILQSPDQGLGVLFRRGVAA